MMLKLISIEHGNVLYLMASEVESIQLDSLPGAVIEYTRIHTKSGNAHIVGDSIDDILAMPEMRAQIDRATLAVFPATRAKTAYGLNWDAFEE